MYAYSKLSDKDKEKIETREYITTRELADILGVDVRQIKRWREKRITLHKENQIEENPQGDAKIGPKFVRLVDCIDIIKMIWKNTSIAQ